MTKKTLIILGIATLGAYFLYKNLKNNETENNDDLSEFKKNLIKLANDEFNKWNKGGVKIKEGAKDTIQDLRNYWNLGAGVKKNDDFYINEAWSSAFISYLMKKAGAGKDFSYSPSHSVYIRDAIKNRKENNDKKFKAYKPEEVNVQVGDLVCFPRQTGVTYDTKTAYMSHCDLITQINGNIATGIGGNVSDSVTKKSYYLSDGKIDKTKSKSVFVVVKNLK